MGTPDFAVGILDNIVKNGYEVVAVVTALDKPAGRGMKMHYSAVKEYALQADIPILQPANLKSETFIDELKSFQPDLFIVVAFRMLPFQVFSLPPRGCFNLHASLLPAYRGAAPINWAIINGEKETGVTTFFIEKEIDTGKIILQQKLEIPEHCTAGILHDELMKIGADLVVKSIELINTPTFNPIPQPFDGDWPKAPKIFPQDCEINWQKNSDSIIQFIRGLSPHPGAYTFIDGKRLKIFNATKSISKVLLQPGVYQSDRKNYLFFGTAQGNIAITELQLEGKKRMTIDEFLRGNNLPKKEEQDPPNQLQ